MLKKYVKWGEECLYFLHKELKRKKCFNYIIQNKGPKFFYFDDIFVNILKSLISNVFNFLIFLSQTIKLFLYAVNNGLRTYTGMVIVFLMIILTRFYLLTLV